MSGKESKEKLYIVRHDGISLPGIKREDIKAGKTVKLDADVGDAYCKRGFLQDADTVVKSEDADAKLIRNNKRLKARVAELEAALAKAAK